MFPKLSDMDEPYFSVKDARGGDIATTLKTDDLAFVSLGGATPGRILDLSTY